MNGRGLGVGLALLLFAALASVSVISAQEETPEATVEATAEATVEATPESTAEPTDDVSEATLEAEATVEATAEATREAPPPGAMLDFPGPGSYTVSVMQGEIERSYGVYIPASYADAEAPAPLVIVLHAANGSALLAERQSGFDELAEESGFIVAYPDGVNGFWNDGRPLDPRVNANISDSAFLAGMIAFLSDKLSIDPARVFATGYSMGGMMALRAACELNGRIAAVASVASTMPEYVNPFCQGSLPLPALFMLGTDDNSIPWSGLARQGQGYLSAAGSLNYWRQHNACADAVETEVLPETAPDDGTIVIVSRYDDCSADASVVLYGIYFGGHTWPGRPSPIGIDPGVVSQEIDGTRVIWEFFSAVGGE